MPSENIHIPKIDLIAFDADDTLWHNEVLYANAQSSLKTLLAKYQPFEIIDRALYATEMRNLQHFGYGIKAFMLSMIETAIEVSDGQIEAHEISQILEIGKAMLRAEVQLLDGVEGTLMALEKSIPLMVITKGDLLDQESKILRSGLSRYFHYVEIVSSKSKESYRGILTRYGIDLARFMMIGNSLKSDILPILEIGGMAVYIPYHLTWAHENEGEVQIGQNGYYQLENIGQLPGLVEQIYRA